MARKLVILSSVGEVTDRYYWSGTPFAIWNALKRRRSDISTHNVMIRYRLQRLFGWANALLGFSRHSPTRVGLGYAVTVRRAQAIVDRAGEADFLHFGSAHLPVRARPGQRHWLFTDSSVFFEVDRPDYVAASNPRMRRAVVDHELAMVRQLDGVFVTADYVGRSFIENDGMPSDKVVSTKTGLGHELPDPGVKEYAGGYILFVAKQNFIGKGGRLLLEAFELLQRERPDARLVVIGNLGDPTQAQDLPRMQNTPGIIFHNFDTPEYRALLAGAALYAGPATHEPWGIIYLEALAVRTPIVGLAHNAFPQFAGDGAYGFIAPNDDAVSVAATLRDALSDPERLARMGAAGRQHVLTEYNWDRVAELILEQFDKPLEAA